MASTLLSTECGSITTFLFCLPAAKRAVPVQAAIPAAAVAVNSFVAVKGGTAPNNVPMPATAALGDKIAVLYQGGSVVMRAGTGATATDVYTFDPVGDLNKVIAFVWDGSKWVLA